MTIRKLSAEDVVACDIAGRPFLHEQGNTVCRGYVVGFKVEDDHWALAVRNVDYLAKMTGEWRPDEATDEYGGSVSAHSSFEEDTADGILTLTGYGMVVYVGPQCDNPWGEVDWPELDGYEGGPMEGNFSKRDRKKRRRPRR